MSLHLDRPLAIAMWDFSWLERRWPGAGYECWEEALDGLVARGYDAVRIDAYPHLHGDDREHTLVPLWNQHDWGSPGRVNVTVRPALRRFVGLCRERGVKVALSTWYREDADDRRLAIADAETQGRQWAGVLDAIEADGALDAVLFVDLCNEWMPPLSPPFFRSDEAEPRFDSPASLGWMSRAVEAVRRRHPGLPYCFSYTAEAPPRPDAVAPLAAAFDLFEPHLWMTHAEGEAFYKRIGYTYPRFDPSGYERMASDAEPLYRSDPARWQGLLRGLIDRHAEWSRSAGLPLVTTEGWAVVDYKDWPMLGWDWIKELCEAGVRHAAASGRWAAVCTSNFCGPQFAGMWRDVDWHRRLTDVIRAGELPPECRREN